MTDKATRDSFGEMLVELGESLPSLVVLDADLSSSTKSSLFARKYPDRFFQMGIAEANMIGTAAGLALTGFVPFACSFAAFVTGPYDTIRMSVGYSQANVKLVGTHAGLGVGEDGYSQMGLEDMNLMRGLPDFVVLNPSDDTTTRAAVRFAVEHVGPVYLRLTRQKLPTLYRAEQVFQCGRGIIVKQGQDVAFIATGATVAEALNAAEDLPQLSPWVIDMPCIKPMDRALIKSLARSCELIVTIEDHSIVGGLGSAVSEILSEEGYLGRLVRLGVQDLYAESGQPHDLYDKYGLSSERISATIQGLISRKNG